MTKYFVYARKSTEEEERQVLSNDAQLHELTQRFRLKQGLDVGRQFVESRSAKMPGRPIFDDMIARIEQGAAQGIIAWHPDRHAHSPNQLSAFALCPQTFDPPQGVTVTVTC